MLCDGGMRPASNSKVTDGQFVTTDIVNYRSDTSDHRPPRSRMWVEPRGRVLRHEAVILGSKLQFVRCPDDVAELMAVRLEDHDEQFAGFPPLDAPDRLPGQSSTPISGVATATTAAVKKE